MTASELTFGVELETAVPRGVVNVGGYHNGTQVPQLPAGWNAQQDGSIECPPGYQSAEFVSPVLRGAEGVRQLLAVIDWLNSVGAKVNRSTGFHVHVGWAGEADPTRRLVTLVAAHEKALYAATGTRSREAGSYCRPISNDPAYQAAFKEAAAGRAATSRYHSLNVTTLSRDPSRRTVEFRVFAGTLNATKAVGYVRLALALAEKALRMSKRTGWELRDPKPTSPIHRKGAGQTALTRLFYGLGWTKGRESYTFGDVTCDGAPTVAAVKKELMRLARKYDGGQENEPETAAPPAPPPLPNVPRWAGTATPPRGAARSSLPVGSPVRLDTPHNLHWHGQTGTVIERRPRRQPVVELADGRRVRVPLRCLRWHRS